MMRNRWLLALLLLAVTASRAMADGGVNFCWDACLGPVNKAASGGGSADAYVSVLGQSQVAQSYQVHVLVGLGYSPIADAWRFDAAGCEGRARFTLNDLAPAAVAASCPSFQGNVPSVHIKDFSYDPIAYRGSITLAVAYPNADPVTGASRGNPAATDPAQRYFLANDHFDLTDASVGPTPADLSTCGGIEVPLCFTVTSASWLDLAGNESFWPIANEFISTNDPNGNHGCPGVVPAAPKTWGAVKGQYRN
jgi:hypothetical protein